MKTLLLTLSLFLSASAFAAWPTCDIATLEDAQSCMKKVAKSMPEFEEANQGFASVRKFDLVKVLKANGLKDSYIKKAADAKFVGFVLVHEDEHKIVYFSMKAGKAVKPSEIYELNIVDLQYDVKSPIKAEEVFLNVPGMKKLDSFEDVQNYLANNEE